MADISVIIANDGTADLALQAEAIAARGRQPASPPHFLGDLWAFAMRPLLGLKAGPS